MPLIVTRSPHTRQPQGAVRPAGGLAFLWTASSPADAVSGRLPTINNATGVIGANGRMAGCSTGQQNIEWANWSPIVTSDGAGTGDFAVLVAADPTSGGSIGHMLAQKNDAGGLPYAQLAFCANSTLSGGSADSGKLAFFVYNSGDSGIAAAGVIDGAMHVFIAARRGSTYELWVDGSMVASSGATILSILQANRYVAVGSRGNGTTEALGANVLAAAAWNYAPAHAALARLRRPQDIWGQLFSPLPRRIWVPSAGSAVPSITAVYADSVTASSVVPRVTLDFA